MIAEWFAVIAATISGVVAGLAWWQSRKNHQDATEQQRRQGAAKLSVWWAHMRDENGAMTLVIDNQTPANVRQLSLRLSAKDRPDTGLEEISHQLQYVPRGTWHVRYLHPSDRRKAQDTNGSQDTKDSEDRPYSFALGYLEAVEELHKYAPNQSPKAAWSVNEFSWLDGVDDERWTRRRGEALELG